MDSSRSAQMEATGGSAAAVSREATTADLCANPAHCCVDPSTCVITDKESLAAITVDSLVSCQFTLGTYVHGGQGTTGVAPSNYPANQCGLSYDLTPWISPATAFNALDHRWLQSTSTPIVGDLGAPSNSAYVFVAVDHGPFPEEGIEATVWGSNSPNLAGFPNGWTLGTLTTIWKRGWEEPAQCEPGDNADDFIGEYSFTGLGFRYIAVHAEGSISIFNDPSHTSWPSTSDNFGTPGWQSDDDELDAVGTPVCNPGSIHANAGQDQIGLVGGQVCFNGAGSSAPAGIASLGWELDGNHSIDATGPTACIPCMAEGEGDVRLFATSSCGCVASDTVHYTCVVNHPPDCSDAVADAGELWPPHHKLVPVGVSGITDPDGDPIHILITDIAQDEPVLGIGDGNTCPDGSGIGSATALLRAERSGSPLQPGDGRVYHVSFEANDGRGGRCTGSVSVCVPHDQGGGHACIDQGPRYDSTICQRRSGGH